ncbi:MAG: hypothetical protein JWM88_1315 [Verrucomicrobia bacterium]|nr:hypothetical protein [Verrucomicrobiota bacterium]
MEMQLPEQIYFLRGLGWLTAAWVTWWLSVAEGFNRRPGAGWLAAFGVVEALRAGLHFLGMGSSAPELWGPDGLAGLAATVVSGAFLWEFSRQIWPRKRSRPSVLAHVLWAVLLILAWWTGGRAAAALATIPLCAAGIMTADRIWRITSAAAIVMRSHGTRIAGVCLALYGLTALAAASSHGAVSDPGRGQPLPAALEFLLSIWPWVFAGSLGTAHLAVVGARSPLAAGLAVALAFMVVVGPMATGGSKAGSAVVELVAVLLAAGMVLAWQRAVDEGRQEHFDRARAESRAKTEFLTFLSHELRTPLQTILGRAELLREQPAAARHAVAIEAQGRMVLRLVTDLLDLGTIEAGRLELKPAPMALRSALDALLDTVRPQAEAKGLALVFACAPAVPDTLMADEARLRQVLGNLLNNAVKFTARGEVRLDVAVAEEVAAAAANGRAALVFTVSDTGPGLPPAGIDRLFTLFMRLDAGEDFRREGTGVGLALVRRLCHLMGGSVTAANRAEGGAVFTVRVGFPFADVVAAPAPSPPTSSGGKLRILVAEDNTAARELLIEAVQLQGHDVTGVADGPAALAACLVENFDTVVADVNLPGFDGIELTRRLRGQGRRLRIVGCSAEAFAATREAALAAGMDAFLTKPVSLHALAEALRSSPTVDHSVFAYLHSPAAVDRTRRALAAEWPRLLADAYVALEKDEPEGLVRIAHYIESSALLAGDAALLAHCRRVAQSARLKDGGGKRGAALDALGVEVGRFLDGAT